MTKNPAEDDEAPAWSPNGRQIAFQTGGDIIVLTLKTGVRRNLTDDGSAHYDSDPSWSPDGTRIVFESYTPPAPTASDDFEYDRIYTVNASNGSDRRLLAEASYSYSEGYGSAFNGTTYSPDGKQIAYVVTRTSGFDITSRLVKMNASDGSNKQVVYESYGGNFEGDVYSALFSPDWGVKVQR